MKTAGYAPRFAADQFEGVRILLLRHEARSAADAVTELHPSELFARIQDPILGQSAQMQHRSGGGVQEIESEIPIRRNIHAVRRNALESQFARHRIAIEREAAAR